MSNPQKGPGIIEQIRNAPNPQKKLELCQKAMRDYKYMRTNTINKVKRLASEK